MLLKRKAVAFSDNWAISENGQVDLFHMLSCGLLSEDNRVCSPTWQELWIHHVSGSQCQKIIPKCHINFGYFIIRTIALIILNCHFRGLYGYTSWWVAPAPDGQLGGSTWEIIDQAMISSDLHRGLLVQYCTALSWVSGLCQNESNWVFFHTLIDSTLDFIFCTVSGFWMYPLSASKNLIPHM